MPTPQPQQDDAKAYELRKRERPPWEGALDFDKQAKAAGAWTDWLRQADKPVWEKAGDVAGKVLESADWWEREISPQIWAKAGEKIRETDPVKQKLAREDPYKYWEEAGKELPFEGTVTKGLLETATNPINLVGFGLAGKVPLVGKALGPAERAVSRALGAPIEIPVRLAGKALAATPLGQISKRSALNLFETEATDAVGRWNQAGKTLDDLKAVAQGDTARLADLDDRTAQFIEQNARDIETYADNMRRDLTAVENIKQNWARLHPDAGDEIAQATGREAVEDLAARYGSTVEKNKVAKLFRDHSDIVTQPDDLSGVVTQLRRNKQKEMGIKPDGLVAKLFDNMTGTLKDLWLPLSVSYHLANFTDNAVKATLMNVRPGTKSSIDDLARSSGLFPPSDVGGGWTATTRGEQRSPLGKAPIIGGAIQKGWDMGQWIERFWRYSAWWKGAQQYIAKREPLFFQSLERELGQSGAAPEVAQAISAAIKGRPYRSAESVQQVFRTFAKPEMRVPLSVVAPAGAASPIWDDFTRQLDALDLADPNLAAKIQALVDGVRGQIRTEAQAIRGLPDGAADWNKWQSGKMAKVFDAFAQQEDPEQALQMVTAIVEARRMVDALSTVASQSIKRAKETPTANWQQFWDARNQQAMDILRGLDELVADMPEGVVSAGEYIDRPWATGKVQSAIARAQTDVQGTVTRAASEVQGIYQQIERAKLAYKKRTKTDMKPWQPTQRVKALETKVDEIYEAAHKKQQQSLHSAANRIKTALEGALEAKLGPEGRLVFQDSEARAAALDGITTLFQKRGVGPEDVTKGKQSGMFAPGEVPPQMKGAKQGGEVKASELFNEPTFPEGPEGDLARARWKRERAIANGQMDMFGVEPLPETQTPLVPASTPEQISQRAADTEVAAARQENAKFPVAQIKVNPERFQFKLATGEGGASGSLKGVQKWDPALAQGIMVWKDPASGQAFVVNGHNRVALAKRLGVPDLENVYWIDAKTDAEARAIGAITNIAEGHGTALDAAKFFRDSGMTVEEALQKLPSRQKIVTDGLALSRLSDGLFSRVRQGEIPIERGAVIGARLEDHALQGKLMQLLDRETKKGRRITNDVVAELADMVAGAPRQKSTQATLFGDEMVTESFALEKAEVLADIKGRLSQDKRVFGVAANYAAELEKGGNVIEREASQNISQNAAQLLAMFDTVKSHVGPISGIIDDAAKRIGAGESAAKVKAGAYEQVVKNLSETLPRGEGAGIVADEAISRAARTEQAAPSTGPTAAPERVAPSTMPSAAGEAAPYPQTETGEALLAPRSVAPDTVYGADQFKAELRSVFNLPEPEARAIEAVMEARARVAGEGLDDYLNKRLAGMDTASPLEEKVFNPQGARGEVFGAATLVEDGRSIITAFRSANVATFLHEMAHVWRKMDLTGEELVTVEKALGVVDGKWAVVHEEAFADSFEKYLRDGYADIPELESVFQKFQRWMTEIYRAFTTDPLQEVEVSPEVKGVFDRMLKTEVPTPPVAPERPVQARWQAPETVVSAKEPWQITGRDYETMYAKVGEIVDGRTVGKTVPNLSSIESSIDNPTVVDGIREVPIAVFEDAGPPKFYSATEEERTKRLAEQIRASGRIDPLIVAYDAKGPYILEGGHRFDALKVLGAKSFPAKVVFDEESLYNAVAEAVSQGKPVPPEVLKDYPDIAARYATPPEAASNLPPGASEAVNAAPEAQVIPEQALPETAAGQAPPSEPPIPPTAEAAGAMPPPRPERFVDLPDIRQALEERTQQARAARETAAQQAAGFEQQNLALADQWQANIEQAIAKGMPVLQQNAAQLAALKQAEVRAVKLARQMAADASEAGNQSQKDIFFDYAAKSNLDELMLKVSPFTIWQTRNIPWYLQQMMSKPALGKGYMAYQRESGQQQEESNIPGRRFQDTVGLGSMGGIGEWATGRPGTQVRGDVLSPFMSIGQQIREPYFAEGSSDVGKAINLTRLGLGGVSLYPWLQLPLQAAGVFGDQPYSDIVPQSRLVRAATGALGNRFDPEQFWKEGMTKLQGQPAVGMNPIEDYYTNKRLAEMVEAGEIRQADATRAMDDKNSPLWQQARAAVQTEQDRMGALRYFLPATMKTLTPEEQAIRTARAGIPPYGTPGSSEAYRQTVAEHPGVAATSAINYSPEKRELQALQNEYYSLPEGQARRSWLASQPVYADYMRYEAATQGAGNIDDYLAQKSIPTERRESLLAAQTQPAVPPVQQAVSRQTGEIPVSGEGAEFYRLQSELMPLLDQYYTADPKTQALQTAYLDLDTERRKTWRAQYPQEYRTLQAYWTQRDQMAQQNPLLGQYLAWRKANPTVPNATQEFITAYLSQSTSRNTAAASSAARLGAASPLGSSAQSVRFTSPTPNRGSGYSSGYSPRPQQSNWDRFAAQAGEALTTELTGHFTSNMPLTPEANAYLQKLYTADPMGTTTFEGYLQKLRGLWLARGKRENMPLWMRQILGYR